MYILKYIKYILKFNIKEDVHYEFNGVDTHKFL